MNVVEIKKLIKESSLSNTDLTDLKDSITFNVNIKKLESFEFLGVVFQVFDCSDLVKYIGFVDEIRLMIFSDGVNFTKWMGTDIYRDSPQEAIIDIVKAQIKYKKQSIQEELETIKECEQRMNNKRDEVLKLEEKLLIAGIS